MHRTGAQEAIAQRISTVQNWEQAAVGPLHLVANRFVKIYSEKPVFYPLILIRDKANVKL